VSTAVTQVATNHWLSPYVDGARLDGRAP